MGIESSLVLPDLIDEEKFRIRCGLVNIVGQAGGFCPCPRRHALEQVEDLVLASRSGPKAGDEDHVMLGQLAARTPIHCAENLGDTKVEFQGCPSGREGVQIMNRHNLRMVEGATSPRGYDKPFRFQGWATLASGVTW
jgi:hypothetical protein